MNLECSDNNQLFLLKLQFMPGGNNQVSDVLFGTEHF